MAQARAALVEGLYESLVTKTLAAAIERARHDNLLVTVERVEGSLLEALLRRHVDTALRHLLVGERAGVVFANDLVRPYGATDEVVLSSEDESKQGAAQMLRAVHRDPNPPRSTTTPLSMSALLTGAADEPRLGFELEREIASCEHVDALISFVTWEGWRRLEPALQDLVRRGGTLRLVTTTYTGATDADAVEAIAALGDQVQVRVSFDGRRTRLHAKAWHFRRRSGFSTAWVGSANLSAAALSSGLEWTMKASGVDLPHVLEKFEGTFETIWNDPEFERFDASAGDLQRLRVSLDRERGRATPVSDLRFFASLNAYPFQQEILDRLEAERELHDRRRNLVVAATGTGKTLIAAFDYARQIPASGIKPRLLFVAHREELLSQSIEAFRHVLRDGAFGTRLGGGFDPEGQHDHLFTTVQSFASRGLAQRYPVDHWDFVIIDECHHSTADTYSEVVERLAPRILLGLTATPERADGKDLLQYFGRRIAAEVRLWHALDRQLLAPFDYFGVADETDLSAVKWSRFGYDVDALGTLYTGNDRRAELVIGQFRHHRGNVRDARALGFCVTVAHAEFMARKFSEAGIPAAAVHGESSDRARRELPGQLERREINVLFTCDLYNEGVDLPFVDALLFLRPTASPTVFLQQLGRGLRLHKDKPSCLVLDFIAKAYRREFRFDRLLSAMCGIPRGQLTRAVEQGFPLLPSGCSLRLDHVAREAIVANLKDTIQGGVRQLKRDLLELVQLRGPGLTLAQFLEESGRPIEELYAAGSFTALRVGANVDPVALSEQEEVLSRRLRLLLHVDDPAQLSLMRDVNAPAVERRVLMLGYQLWHGGTDLFDADETRRRLNAVPRLRDEIQDIAAILEGNVGLAPTAPLPAQWTLQLHRAYQRREILTGVGAWTSERKQSSREGVLRIGANGEDELFFVTLVKDEKRFSPTTRYRDYAISRQLFHWQSQSSTPEEGPIGSLYQSGERRFWLFVRRTDQDPFHFLGPVKYVRHEGSRPMNITWRLAHPMPASLFQQYASLVAA